MHQKPSPTPSAARLTSGSPDAAMTGLVNAATEVKDAGQFGFLDQSVTTADLLKLMRI